jgi:hypothetical protein
VVKEESVKTAHVVKNPLRAKLKIKEAAIQKLENKLFLL